MDWNSSTKCRPPLGGAEKIASIRDFEECAAYVGNNPAGFDVLAINLNSEPHVSHVNEPRGILLPAGPKWEPNTKLIHWQIRRGNLSKLQSY
jgi:hypothetical protein